MGLVRDFHRAITDLEEITSWRGCAAATWNMDMESCSEDHRTFARGASDLNTLISEPSREDLDLWKFGHVHTQEEFDDLHHFDGVFSHLKRSSVLPADANERPNGTPCCLETLTPRTAAKRAMTLNKSWCSGNSAGLGGMTSQSTTASRKTLTPLETYIYREDSNLMPA